MVTDTSIRAYYEAVLPNLAVTQALVLNLVVEHMEIHNWTNRELREALEEYTGNAWLISTVVPRVNELRKKGLLELDEKRTCSVSGMRVNAVKLNLQGYKEKMNEEARQLAEEDERQKTVAEWFT